MDSISDKIFQNAIASIELGIEDYNLIKKDKRRIISSVRNIFAGIILLFKSKLAYLSKNNNGILICKNINPILKDGNIVWQAEGRKTIEYDRIKQLFKNFDIEFNWSTLDKLREHRNNVEHYFEENSNMKNMQQYIAESFTIIYDFLDKHLQMSPQNTFSENVWEIFINESKLYFRELSKNHDKLDSLKWYSNEILQYAKNISCPECDSRLISVSSNVMEAQRCVFKCINCSYELDYDILTDCILNDLNFQYEEDIIGYCPNCENYSYDSLSETCIKCGEKGPFECIRCGDTVPVSELICYSETNMCGYCSHMSEKIMSE